MSDLEFKPISLDDRDKVYGYMSRYGEGSCQHSFVSMYSLFEKYGDSIAEDGGFLYVLRSHLCDDTYRVYLAPMGEGDPAAAYRNILDDAHKYGRKVKFITLTEKQKSIVENVFGGLFDYYNDRDLAEYVYSAESMATFSGGKLAKRRKEVHHFTHVYGDRAQVTPITPEDHAEIIEFEKFWLEQNKYDHNIDSLEREARAISLQLQNYETLCLSGIVLRIDGAVRGYGYGTKLSDEYYDALIEKGDKDIIHVYKVLRQEAVRQCSEGCRYVNLEEDLGIEGLRNLKYAYQPEFLIDKYIVTEL